MSLSPPRQGPAVCLYHRMGQVGRDHSGIVCSSRVIPEHEAQDWSIPSAPSLVCVLLLGHCTVKKLFLISRWNFLCMFLPVPPVLSLGTFEQSPAHEHEPGWPQGAEELNPTPAQPNHVPRTGRGRDSNPSPSEPQGPRWPGGGAAAPAPPGSGSAAAVPAAVAERRPLRPVPPAAMSAAGLVSAPPAAPPGPPAPAMAPAPDYYEEEELESAEEEDGERSARARDSDEGVWGGGGSVPGDGGMERGLSRGV